MGNAGGTKEEGWWMKMKRYEAVLFDLDGTLLDTLEDLKDSVNYVMVRYGFPERTLDEVRKAVGNGIRKLIERSVPQGTAEETIESAYDDFMVYYKKNCMVKTKPYPGIEEVLRKLKAEGCKLAVVTNKGNEAVQEMIPYYFEGLFEIAVGATKEMPKKPAPDTVYYALEKVKVEKEKALFVGDSQVDVETAKNAGMDSILVTWGFRSREVLEEAGAPKLADSAGELYEKMQEI